MPGFLIHLNATVLCSHGGQATPTAPDARVLVSGQPLATLGAPYVVAGCPLPPSAGGPCITGQFTTAATRIIASGRPVLLVDSFSTCVPTGTPLLIAAAQTRVAGV